MQDITHIINFILGFVIILRMLQVFISIPSAKQCGAAISRTTSTSLRMCSLMLISLFFVSSLLLSLPLLFMYKYSKLLFNGFIVGSISSFISAYIGTMIAIIAQKRTYAACCKSYKLALNTFLFYLTLISLTVCCAFGLVCILVYALKHPPQFYLFALMGASFMNFYTKMVAGIFAKTVDIASDVIPYDKITKKGSLLFEANGYYADLVFDLFTGLCTFFTCLLLSAYIISTNQITICKSKFALMVLSNLALLHTFNILSIPASILRICMFISPFAISCAMGHSLCLLPGVALFSILFLSETLVKEETFTIRLISRSSLNGFPVSGIRSHGVSYFMSTILMIFVFVMILYTNDHKQLLLIMTYLLPFVCISDAYGSIADGLNFKGYYLRSEGYKNTSQIESIGDIYKYSAKIYFAIFTIIVSFISIQSLQGIISQISAKLSISSAICTATYGALVALISVRILIGFALTAVSNVIGSAVVNELANNAKINITLWNICLAYGTAITILMSIPYVADKYLPHAIMSLIHLKLYYFVFIITTSILCMTYSMQMVINGTQLNIVKKAIHSLSKERKLEDGVVFGAEGNDSFGDPLKDTVGTGLISYWHYALALVIFAIKQ